LAQLDTEEEFTSESKADEEEEAQERKQSKAKQKKQHKTKPKTKDFTKMSHKCTNYKTIRQLFRSILTPKFPSSSSAASSRMVLVPNKMEPSGSGSGSFERKAD
jgi:hypothetical protein